MEGPDAKTADRLVAARAGKSHWLVTISGRWEARSGIEATVEPIDAEVERAQAIMAEASRIVLGGFEIGTDADVVKYPDRYMDEAGKDFWNTVTRLAGPLKGRQEC
jgi:hypothetical protein